MNEQKNPNDTNGNDYLWDRSGAPDPEIQRLESALSEFRYTERPLVLPADVPISAATTGAPSFLRRLQKGWVFSFESGPSSPYSLQKGWLLPRFTAAAVLVLALAAVLVFTLRRAGAPGANSNIAWNVSTLEGAPQIGTKILSANQRAAQLQVGQTLTTNSNSRVTLSQNDLGQIQVDPNSQLRLVQSGPDHKRLQLDLGTIHAYIWAPPTQFVVDTPSAIAVDLGCAYTLEVQPDGSGTIRTTMGWVGFHRNGRDSFIPAGALCHTRPNVGPGTPYFEEASPAFREALHNFDNAPEPENASAPLEIILREARAKDALTLWHLLSRTTASQREKVYDRLATLVPPPPGTTREAILQLNPTALDLCWNALNLGDIQLWRYYEQSSNSTNSPPPTQLPPKKLPKQPPQ